MAIYFSKYIIRNTPHGDPISTPTAAMATLNLQKTLPKANTCLESLQAHYRNCIIVALTGVAMEQQYLNLLQDIIDNGIDKPDRTNIGNSKAVIGRTLRFDLSKGFPILTTRKLPLRIAFEETMFFLRGDTNTKLLEDKNINIWRGNTSREFLDSRELTHLPEGSLGRGYGHQWRKWELNGDHWKSSVDLIRKNTIKGNNLPFSLSIPLEPVDYTNSDDFVGKTFPTKSSGDIIILKKLPTINGNTSYRIQFLTGINYVTAVTRPAIRSGQIKNPYNLTQAGGCCGPSRRKSPYISQAYTLWRNMMERCHGIDPIKIVNYKQKGIFVDSRWRCFANFYDDLHFIVGFDDWKHNPAQYQLDKDYFGSDYYGKDSCIFLPRKYNEDILNNKNIYGQRYKAENKITKEIFYFTAPYFFNKYTNTRGLVDRAFLNQKGETKIWKFTKEDPPDGYLWRQKFYVDQIKDLLIGLKHDPFGRRHVVTGWNPAELNEMALPPCHMLHTYSVTPDNRLHSSFVMRSNDVYHGLPFNIMGYALLNEIFAKHLGLIPGDLVYMGHDVHIYHHQIDVVKQQIERTPRPFPKLIIKKDLPTLESIMELQWDDIDLIGYDPHPALNKVEMAI